MLYNFDEIIDRRHTDALKIEALEQQWHRTDLIPLWIADMDFRTPPFVLDAIRRRLDDGVLGYTQPTPRWGNSIKRWLEQRHGWSIETDMLTFSPGIVAGIASAVKCFTSEGDKVMVQPPVYHPFFRVTQETRREVVWSPLRLDEHQQIQIDFDRFAHDVKGCKLFILCNPHNPGGRVWTLDELRTMARICRENGVLVVSDEIHADLTYPPYKHYPFANVSDDAKQIAVTFMAISKAFNAPGLSSSYCIIENATLRAQFQEYVKAGELDMGHIFAFCTVAAAYEQGAEWLSEVIAYIQANVDYTEQFLAAHTPKIKMIRPQASFLIFLDCRELGLEQESLVRFFEDEAHLALNRGDMFGKEGVGFMRINIATPRPILEKALNLLAAAYRKRM
jgi:cystathionine beta-lyase